MWTHEAVEYAMLTPEKRGGNIESTALHPHPPASTMRDAVSDRASPQPRGRNAA
jgi:hypothetical protein